MPSHAPPPVYVETPGYSQPIPAQYYGGQQGGYNLNVSQPGCIVITQQPVAAAQYTPLGETTSSVNCPNCHANVLTNVRFEPNTQTHLIALCLFCFICWPCVCLPYCMDSCQNANHYCPNCNAFIGTYKS